MGTEYLLDTNVIIDFSSQKLPKEAHINLFDVLDKSPKISVVNKIELLSLPVVPNSITQFTEEAVVFPLSNEIVEKTIELRKKYRVKLPDAIIAATAVVYGLTLITHNISDFQNIKNLKVIDSYLL